jgi:hypothetical protein
VTARGGRPTGAAPGGLPDLAFVVVPARTLTGVVPRAERVSAARTANPGGSLRLTHGEYCVIIRYEGCRGDRRALSRGAVHRIADWTGSAAEPLLDTARPAL